MTKCELADCYGKLSCHPAWRVCVPWKYQMPLNYFLLRAVRAASREDEHEDENWGKRNVCVLEGGGGGSLGRGEGCCCRFPLRFVLRYFYLLLRVFQTQVSPFLIYESFMNVFPEVGDSEGVICEKKTNIYILDKLRVTLHSGVAGRVAITLIKVLL